MLRSEVLPGIVAGEIVAAWCIAGPAAVGRDGVASPRPRRRRLVLDGVLEPVEDAGQADELLVTAVHVPRGGLTQCLVPASAPGVHIEAIESVDLVRRFATVHLDGVRVAGDRVVGEVGGAANAVERQLHLAIVLQSRRPSARSTGLSSSRSSTSADRSSFGRPLASYQAIKHRIADMKMWIEALPRCHRARGASGAGRRSRGAPRS